MVFISGETKLSESNPKAREESRCEDEEDEKDQERGR